ncbi:MAG: S-layer homology domain-containing protein [Bacillota bacterium]
MKKSILVLFLLGLLHLFFGGPVEALPVQGQIFQGRINTAQNLNAVKFSDINNHWARESIHRMALQSIIRGYGDGRFLPDQAMTKEETLAILIRLLGQEERARELTAPNGNWSDGYLVAAVAQGIISEVERREMVEGKRRQPAERQEVGLWVGRVLGLKPVPETRQVAVFGFRDRNRINEAWLPMIEAVVQEGVFFGVSPGLFGPREPITRGQIAAIADRINPKLAGLRGVSIFAGELLQSREREILGGGQPARLVEYLVLADNGQVIFLQAGPQMDFIVAKGQALGLSGTLTAGERLQVVVAHGQVIYVEAAPASVKNIPAVLQQVDSTRREIIAYPQNGPLTSFRLGPQAAVRIGSREASLKDLLPGQEVILSLKGDQVTRVQAMLEDLMPGYRQPHQFAVTGRLREIGAGGLTIFTSQEERTYTITGFTQVLRQGRPVKPRELKTGETLRLLVNEELEVMRVEAAGPASRVTGIYRGRLDKVNPAARQAVLYQVAYLDAGEWQPRTGLMTIDLAPEAEFYIGDQPVAWSEMAQQFRHQEVYLAVLSPFGQETAVKLVAKTGEAELLNGQVRRLSYGQEQVELRGWTTPFQFGPGTIVVKNRQLVEPEDLSSQDHLFLIANREDALTRAVVIISQEYLPAGFQIARGVLDRVREEDFRLHRYSFYDGMRWQEAGTSSQYASFSLSHEGKVLDFTEDSLRLLTPEDFRRSRFSGKYINEYVYLISRQGRVEAMVIYPYRTISQALKTSLGRVTAINEQGVLRLERVQDWSEGNQKWIANPLYLSLDSKASLVIKGEQAADRQSFQVGEEVLVLHDHQQIYVAIIQE